MNGEGSGVAVFFFYFPGLLMVTLFGVVLGFALLFIRGIRGQGLAAVLTSLFGPIFGGVIFDVTLETNDSIWAWVGKLVFVTSCAIGPGIGIVALQVRALRKSSKFGSSF